MYPRQGEGQLCNIRVELINKLSLILLKNIIRCIPGFLFWASEWKTCRCPLPMHFCWKNIPLIFECFACIITTQAKFQKIESSVSLMSNALLLCSQHSPTHSNAHISLFLTHDPKKYALRSMVYSHFGICFVNWKMYWLSQKGFVCENFGCINITFL